MLKAFSNRTAISFRGSVILIALLWASFAPPPLAQPSVTAEKHSGQLAIVRVNGVALHYMERGTGIPVIFVHGALDDYRMWEAQIESFSQAYHVIAYSRRYNYPNDNPDIDPDHSAIVEAEDLAALIKKLKLKRVHIIGHSYGALTALFLAVRHPELVRTLVVAEPPALRWAQDNAEGRVLFDLLIE